MNILFEPLFSVNISHGFFSPKNLDSPLFSIIPTRLCQHSMRDLGLVFRETAAGFVVHYEYREATVGDGTSHVPVRPFPEKLCLSFMLIPKMNRFLNRTKISIDDEDIGIYRFSNLAGNELDEKLRLNQEVTSTIVTDHDQKLLYPQTFADLVISPDRFVQFQVRDEFSTDPVISFSERVMRDKTGDATGTASGQIDLSRYEPGMYSLERKGSTIIFYAHDEAYRKRPLGVVDVFIHPDVPETYRLTDSGGRATPKIYHLAFGSREIWWRYVVVLRDRAGISASDLSIEGSNESSDESFGTAMEFEDPVSGTLSNGIQTLSYISKGKIALHQQPKTGFSLVKKGSRPFSLDNLPNPDGDRLIPHESFIKEYISESYIYI